jgi:hypothetical protein
MPNNKALFSVGYGTSLLSGKLHQKKMPFSYRGTNGIHPAGVLPAVLRMFSPEPPHSPNKYTGKAQTSQVGVVPVWQWIIHVYFARECVMNPVIQQRKIGFCRHQ